MISFVLNHRFPTDFSVCDFKRFQIHFVFEILLGKIEALLEAMLDLEKYLQETRQKSAYCDSLTVIESRNQQ